MYGWRYQLYRLNQYINQKNFQSKEFFLIRSKLMIAKSTQEFQADIFTFLILQNILSAEKLLKDLGLFI